MVKIAGREPGNSLNSSLNPLDTGLRSDRQIANNPSTSPFVGNLSRLTLLTAGAELLFEAQRSALSGQAGALKTLGELGQMGKETVQGLFPQLREWFDSTGLVMVRNEIMKLMASTAAPEQRGEVCGMACAGLKADYLVEQRACLEVLRELPNKMAVQPLLDFVRRAFGEMRNLGNATLEANLAAP